MARTYRKPDLAKDDRGYIRYFGGRRFRLGSDAAQARLAAARLEVLFSRCAGEWGETTVAIADAVARGSASATISYPGNLPVNEHQAASD